MAPNVGQHLPISTIMRPASRVIAVDDEVREVSARFDTASEDILLVVDDGEPLGYVDARELLACDRPDGFPDELVGNLMSTRIAVCRPDDTIGEIGNSLTSIDVDIIAVVDRRRNLLGWTWAPDIATQR
jgi:Mg/Co/Ni transporter MgtE